MENSSDDEENEGDRKDEHEAEIDAATNLAPEEPNPETPSMELLEQRVRKPPSYMNNCVTNSVFLAQVDDDWVVNADGIDPVTYEEAAQ